MVQPLERFTDNYARLDRVLDTIGDGEGTTNANVNGSVTPVVFKIAPPASGWIAITHLHALIRDNGNFSAEKYGVIAGLTNGIQVGMFLTADDSLLVDYLSGLPIKNNTGWGRANFDVDVKAWAAGDEILLSEWNLTDAGTTPKLTAGDAFYFGVKIRDDLTTLVEHYFTIEGFVGQI